MRLHTELTRPELYAALTACKDAGLVAWHVFISRDDVHPSTTHSNAYEVELFTAHGTVRGSEWTGFINELHSSDPSLVIDLRIEA